MSCSPSCSPASPARAPLRAGLGGAAAPLFAAGCATGLLLFPHMVSVLAGVRLERGFHDPRRRRLHRLHPEDRRGHRRRLRAARRPRRAESGRDAARTHPRPQLAVRGRRDRALQRSRHPLGRRDVDVPGGGPMAALSSPPRSPSPPCTIAPSPGPRRPRSPRRHRVRSDLRETPARRAHRRRRHRPAPAPRVVARFASLLGGLRRTVDTARVSAPRSSSASPSTRPNGGRSTPGGTTPRRIIAEALAAPAVTASAPVDDPEVETDPIASTAPDAAGAASPSLPAPSSVPMRRIRVGTSAHAVDRGPRRRPLRG